MIFFFLASANLRHSLCDKANRERHQFRCFVTGEPEHHTLVAGAFQVEAHQSFFLIWLSSDLLTPIFDIVDCFLNTDNDTAGLVIEVIGGVGVKPMP